MRREPRTFDGERRPVGELTPIDVDALSPEDALRALYRGVVQTHGCLESHITEFNKYAAAQQLAQGDATLKRQELAGDLLAVKDDVRLLTLAMGVKQPAEGETPPKAKGVAHWTPWKLFAALGGVGIGAPALAQLLSKVSPVVWQWLLDQAGK